MAVCPNCGTNNNDGAKFCFKCGVPVKTSSQPVQQAASQMPQGFTPIPAPPAGFTPLAPENPLPGEYTPIQPVYAQPITQPVQKPINGPKSNGFCNAGLIFSIIGLGTVGLTSPLGFLFSGIGLISAKKKHQPGTGKAIFGLISSGLIIFALTVTFATIWKDIKYEFDYGNIRNPLDLLEAIDNATDRTSSDYKARIKPIVENGWVSTGNDNVFLEFGSNYTYKFFDSIDNVKDNYYAGSYKIFIGSDGMSQVDKMYRKYVTRSEINQLIAKNREFDRENFVLLILESEGRWENGEKKRDDKLKTPYYGFYVKTTSGTAKLVLFHMETGTRFDFATEKYYKANS